MIVLLSPAKTLDFSDTSLPIAHNAPRGFQDAEHLITDLEKLSKSQLKALLKVSDSITSENYNRIQGWKSQPTKACLFTYNGAAFHGLRAHDFSAEDQSFADQHLRIISGLYGLLKPLDVIKPYRLEMGCKLQTDEAANLYLFWQTKLLQWLKEDLEGLPDEQRVIINCASQEYAKAIKLKELSTQIIDISFPGYAMLAKPARGAMARFIIKERVISAEGLKAFTGNNNEWKFAPEQSTATKFVYAKQSADSKGESDGNKAKPKAKQKSQGGQPKRATKRKKA